MYYNQLGDSGIHEVDNQKCWLPLMENESNVYKPMWVKNKWKKHNFLFIY